MSEINKLTKKIFITGEIEAKTGLHIGGSNTGMSIGGADSVVIRNPINNQPYIPGSSLKGKMRSLLEKLYGKVKLNRNGGADPCNCRNCEICCVFGVSAGENGGLQSRLIVRDGELTNEEYLRNAPDTDMPYSEVKTEVVIDRITSSANPRQIERVPAGARFKLDMVLNLFEEDNEKKLLGKVFEGLEILQDDYLGGSGTRGYGQIKIKIQSPLKYKDQNYYETEGVQPKDYTETVPAALKG